MISAIVVQIGLYTETCKDLSAYVEKETKKIFKQIHFCVYKYLFKSQGF